jgi:hypothetical protein
VPKIIPCWAADFFLHETVIIRQYLANAGFDGMGFIEDQERMVHQEGGA